MKIISFDSGGVVSTNPPGFIKLWKRLKDAGYESIIVTAFGKAKFIPEGDDARSQWIIDKMAPQGIVPGVTLLAIFATMDYGYTDPRTGAGKAEVLNNACALAHIDDSQDVLDNLKDFNGERILYTGQSMDELYEILTKL